MFELVKEEKTKYLIQRHCFNACRTGDLKGLKEILKNYSLDEFNRVNVADMLISAMISGHFNIVKYFTDDKKVELDISDLNGAMNWCMVLGNLKMIKYIVKKYQYKLKVRHLMNAVLYGYIDICKFLLSFEDKVYFSEEDMRYVQGSYCDKTIAFIDQQIKAKKIIVEGNMNL